MKGKLLQIQSYFSAFQLGSTRGSWLSLFGSQMLNGRTARRLLCVGWRRKNWLPSTNSILDRLRTIQTDLEIPSNSISGRFSETWCQVAK